MNGNPTQLRASWLPPNPPNGIITGYTVYCNVSTDQVYEEQVPTGETLFAVGVLNDDTAVLVTGLMPFTRYVCVVTANTSAGEGELSDPQNATTDQDGECAAFDLCSFSPRPTLLGASQESLETKPLYYLVVEFPWVYLYLFSPSVLFCARVM